MSAQEAWNAVFYQVFDEARERTRLRVSYDACQQVHRRTSDGVHGHVSAQGWEPVRGTLLEQLAKEPI